MGWPGLQAVKAVSQALRTMTDETATDPPEPAPSEESPDPAPPGTRRVALQVAYDGSAYCGWQVQAGRADAPSVQAAIEAALAGLLRHPVRVTGSGRTDSGVHAVGQVAHFDTSARIPAEAIRRALNTLLPAGLGVLRAAEVEPTFHARFDAIRRAYVYRLVTGEPAQAALCRNAVGVAVGHYDAERMQAAARVFLGEHEFAGFRSTSCVAKRTRLTMEQAELQPMPPEAKLALGLGPGAQGWLFAVACRSFLMHMVRRMVGSLLLVGRGRQTPEELAACLREGRRPEYVLLAPAAGLVLQRVEYPRDPFAPAGVSAATPPNDSP